MALRQRPHRPPALPDEGTPSLARRSAVFTVVAVALFMASVDMTMVATALSSIERDLGAGLAWGGWVITVYSLGQIVVLPLAGRLSDQFGRKRVFLTAVSVFTVASLCCGLVDDIGWLIAFRALQALGGGAILPSATGIVADHFGRNRDRAIGTFSSIFPIGAVVGPVLGGVLLGYASWRWIFFVNVPIGIVLLACGALIIGPTARQATARADIVGAGLLAVTLVAAMLGITLVGTGPGLINVGVLGAEAVALIAGLLLYKHVKRHPNPVLLPQLLRGRNFGVLNIVNVLFGAAVIGTSALIPLYAERRYGIAPTEAGTLLTARAIGMIVVSALAVMALRRSGYRLPIVVGLVLVSIGLFLIAVPPPMAGYPWLALAAGLTGIGMGLALPSSNNASLQLAPEHVSAITGLRGMFRHCGGLIAISVTTAAIAQSSEPTATHAVMFGVFAVLLLMVTPLILAISDHRGRW